MKNEGKLEISHGFSYPNWDCSWDLGSSLPLDEDGNHLKIWGNSAKIDLDMDCNPPSEKRRDIKRQEVLRFDRKI